MERKLYVNKEVKGIIKSMEIDDLFDMKKQIIYKAIVELHIKKEKILSEKIASYGFSIEDVKNSPERFKCVISKHDIPEWCFSKEEYYIDDHIILTIFNEKHSSELDYENRKINYNLSFKYS